jgi:hypothetical protein
MGKLNNKVSVQSGVQRLICGLAVHNDPDARAKSYAQSAGESAVTDRPDERYGVVEYKKPAPTGCRTK